MRRRERIKESDGERLKEAFETALQGWRSLKDGSMVQKQWKVCHETIYMATQSWELSKSTGKRNTRC